ncbi:MAG: DUF1552 domain-containing protein, partial [Planctomycetales bacterium]|nr:DUF1552 domain-containing protein [Planctomycetales bacterium]
MKRRTLLKAAGCTLALPPLESLGADKDFAAGSQPKRLFILTSGYGVYLPHFYPAKTGRDFEFQECAKDLEPLREHLTLLGNLAHTPVLNGHHNQDSILTGSRQAATFGDSLDQFAAKHLGEEVPFDCLTMRADYRPGGGTSVRNRVPVAQLYNPEEIFNQFFGKKDVDQRLAAINRDKSVLDLCRDQARALAKNVSAGDRKRLEEYFNSIRETEKFLNKNAQWISQPAPDTGYAKEDFQHPYQSGMFPPDYAAYYDSLLTCVELAFRFDLTRVAHLSLHYVGPSHHGATHHGNREASIAALKRHDTLLFSKFAGRLTKFKNTQMPEGGTLMDQTVSLYTAGLGDAAAHSGRNLPAVLAGGKFQHGSFIRFAQPQDISDLFLTVLQHVGVETGSFITGSHTLDI